MRALTAKQTHKVGLSSWYALAVLTLIYSFSYADRYLIASLGQPIKQEFGLSDSFLGMLMGPAFALLYGCASVPIGRAADRYRRATIITVGCLCWSLFTLMSGFAGTATELAIYRVGVGIGEAAFLAPAYSLLTDRFPAERRGLAFAILALGLYLGQLAAYVGGPIIAEAGGGWQAAFVALGSAGICLALLAALSLREPPRGASVQNLPKLGAVVRGLSSERGFILANAGMALGSFSGLAYGMWATTLFARSFDVSLTVAGSAFGLAFGPSALVGALAFGALSDRLSLHDHRWRLRLAALSLILATLTILGVTFAPNLRIATIFVIFGGILGGGWSIGVLTSLQTMLPPQIRVTATAIFTLVAILFSAVCGPWIVGLISDAIGTNDAASLRKAMAICIIVGFPGGIYLWKAAEHEMPTREGLLRRFGQNPMDERE